MAEVHSCRHVVRLELDCAMKLSQGVDAPRFGAVGAADRMECGRELRVDLESVLQLDDRLVVLPFGLVGDSSLEVLLLLDVRVLGAGPSKERDHQVGPEQAHRHL